MTRPPLHDVSKGLAVALLVAGLLTLLLAGPVGTAAAQTPDPAPPSGQTDGQADTTGPSPEPTSTPGSVFSPDRTDSDTQPLDSGAGIDQLLRGPDLKAGNAATAYERYGLSGLKLVDDSDVLDFGDNTIQQVPDVVWAVATWITGVASSTTQWAFSYDAFDHLSPVVDSAVGRLYHGLFRPLLLPFLLLTGGWAAWQLLSRRGSAALQGSLWTVAVIALAFGFLARPGSVANAANQLTIGLSRQVLSAVATTTGGAAVVGEIVPDPATYRGADDDRALRQAADQLYRQTLIVPWMLANFGTVEAAATPRPDDPEGNPTFAAGLLDYLTVEAGEEPAVQQQRLEALLDEARGLDGVSPWIQGDVWGGRLSIAVIALLGTTVLGGMVLLVAGAVLLAQLGLLLAVLASPLFLILGAWPGGRHVFRRFAGLAGSLLVRRIAYATILAILLVALDAVAADTSALSYGLSVLVQALLVGAVVYFRGDLLELFDPDDAMESAREKSTTTLKRAGRRVFGWRQGGRGSSDGASGSDASAATVTTTDTSTDHDGNGHEPTRPDRPQRPTAPSRGGDEGHRDDRRIPARTATRPDEPSADRDPRWVGRVYQPAGPPPDQGNGQPASDADRPPPA